MSETAAWIDETVQIPALLCAAPHTRAVLDRYGLRGCGGPLGPQETLGFFARAHDVPVGQLLDELRACLDRPSAGGPKPPTPAGGRADTIYRPFFKAGITVVLTLGAVWGAYLLLRIAWQGSFTAAGLHEVNAHGHAQIFGWVGLFVMGFAYQAFPRFKHTTLAHPRLAYASLGLMLAGVVTRSVLEPLAVAWPVLIGPVVGAAALEVLAIGLFAWVVVATWRASGKPLAFYDPYIACGLGWFVLQALGELVYLTATLTAEGERLVDLVATWQGPLRDIQIHGFALLMILGVSQRVFHPFYGLPAPDEWRSRWALIGLNAAVAGEVLGLVLMRLANPAWAALWYASVLLLAGTAGWLVASWRLHTPPAESDRSLKFLRAAYAWLFLSLGMLVLLPAYQHGLLGRLAPDSPAAQLGFSHAYYGAARHAVTVGFISLMIVGVAARVVPTLNGVDPRRLAPLGGPFLLLNVGCSLRVVSQILTDYTVVVFPLAGLSGLLEVAGLAIWGVHLWRIMSGRGGTSAPAGPPWEAGAAIVAGDHVGEILEREPALLSVFLAFGFHTLSNPLLRKTVARHVTLEAACRFISVDLAELLAALNAARPKPAGRRSLPVLSADPHPPSPSKESAVWSPRLDSKTNTVPSARC